MKARGYDAAIRQSIINVQMRNSKALHETKGRNPSLVVVGRGLYSNQRNSSANRVRRGIVS
jgi:hypothetical protein